MSVLGLSVIPAAALAWPRRSPRTQARMFVAGFITVLLGFVIVGLVFGLVTVFDQGSSVSVPMRLVLVVPMIGMAILFGTLITLGIPYVVGGAVSLLFADPVD